MWRRIVSLIVKELRTLMRDPKSRFVVIGPPLIQLFIFSYAATYDVTNVRLAVFDESRTLESRQLLSRFEAAPVIRSLVRVHSAKQLHDMIERRDVDAALHIGPRFAADMRHAPPARVMLVLDGRRSNTAQILSSYIQTILLDYAAEWGAAHGYSPPPATIVARALFNPNMESRWVIVPGLAGVLTMVVALVVTALSVARERELGTFEQLLVTPLRPMEILIGKTVPALIIGLGEATVIVGAALLWFKVPLTGSVLLLYAAIVTFLLAIIGFGLFISSLAQTQQQAIVGAFLFLVPAITLSGFATPIENMPAWVQAVTEINPLRHMMVILRGVFLKAMPVSVALDSLWPIAAIATVTLVGATWFFRRRLG